MARIPLQVAQRSLDTGSVVQYPSGSPVGAALESAGNTLQGVAERFQQKQEQRDRFDATIRENEFTAQLAGLEDEAIRSAPADAGGLHDGVYGEIDPVTQRAVKPGSFDQVFDSYLARVPESQRADFAAKREIYRKQGSNRLAEAQYKGEQAYYGVEIQKTQNQITSAIAASDPNDTATFDAFKSQGLNAIDKSGLPALAKDVARTNWLAKADESLFQAKLAKDPEFASKARAALGLAPPAASSGNVVDRIIGVESGGNPTAKNPGSSATGLGQFTSGTWVEIVREYEPSLAEGRSRAELLALRNDPTISRRMTGYLVQKNTRALQAAGVPANDGNTYLAHFAGSGGAIALLKADPGASAESVLGSAAVNANPFLRGKTASDVIAWAAKKMGSATPAKADPQFANIPLERRLVLANAADVQVGETERTAAASAKAQYVQYKDAVELAVVQGKTVDEGIISNDGILNDGDKATLIKSLRSQNETSNQIRSDLTALGDRSLTLDAYSSKDKTRADNLYTDAAKRVPAEQQGAVASAIIEQTGVVPQPVVNSIRRGLSSTVPADVIAAAQTAQRISAFDQAALARRDGGADAQKAADDFSFYVNKLNLTPEEAARRMIDANTPEKKFQRKALEPAAKEFVKEISDEDLASNFNESWLGSDPTIGTTPAQELGIKAEFIAIAEDQFYAANGDPELAKNRAVEQMKRLYGVSEFGGGKTIMKHPPERYWPKASQSGFLGIGDNPLQYATTQLYQDVYGIDPEHQPGSVQLVTTPETDREVKAGELPGYAVLWKDKDGVLQTMPGKLWRPDVKGMVKIEQQRAEKEQAEAIDRARQADTDLLAGRDRETTLDNFLASPTQPPQYTPSRKGSVPGSNIPSDLPSAVDDLTTGNPMGN